MPLVLKQYKWVDKIVVLNYRFINVKPSLDNTQRICNLFSHPNLVYERGRGVEQHEIFNRGLDLLQDCNLAFIADADEILLPSDQEEITRFMSDRRGLIGQADSAACKIIDYNGDLFHASPQRAYPVTVAVVPQVVRFNHIRNINNNRVKVFPDITLHHLGLVFPEETIKWKSEWEFKEEGHSRNKLLKDWGVRREVKPPQELLNFIGELYEQKL
ncbi:MAG TPA: hypothetical protein PKM71_08545 [Candidatus Cloacimonas sp.]|nr:hypothetical protein [Candidatus Cloacimonas sp.]